MFRNIAQYYSNQQCYPQANYIISLFQIPPRILKLWALAPVRAYGADLHVIALGGKPLLSAEL